MTNHKDLIVKAFNDFDGKNLNLLDSFYDPQISFADPVQAVEGLDKLKAYYKHAYKNVTSIRFEFREIFKEGQSYCGPWTMHLQAKGLNSGKMFTVEGCSVFHFNEKNLVIRQRDYLDLGEMLYEKLPIQGFVILKLKQFLQV
jgi:hypothetical protein